MLEDPNFSNRADLASCLLSEKACLFGVLLFLPKETNFARFYITGTLEMFGVSGLNHKMKNCGSVSCV